MIQRLPFNWKNPLGYSVAVLVGTVFVIMEMKYLGCFLRYKQKMEKPHDVSLLPIFLYF